jgi:hypothetical protein
MNECRSQRLLRTAQYALSRVVAPSVNRAAEPRRAASCLQVQAFTSFMQWSCPSPAFSSSSRHHVMGDLLRTQPQREDNKAVTATHGIQRQKTSLIHNSCLRPSTWANERKRLIALSEQRHMLVTRQLTRLSPSNTPLCPPTFRLRKKCFAEKMKYRIFLGAGGEVTGHRRRVESNGTVRPLYSHPLDERVGAWNRSAAGNRSATTTLVLVAW